MKNYVIFVDFYGNYQIISVIEDDIYSLIIFDIILKKIIMIGEDYFEIMNEKIGGNLEKMMLNYIHSLNKNRLIKNGIIISFEDFRTQINTIYNLTFSSDYINFSVTNFDLKLLVKQKRLMFKNFFIEDSVTSIYENPSLDVNLDDFFIDIIIFDYVCQETIVKFLEGISLCKKIDGKKFIYKNVGRIVFKNCNIDFDCYPFLLAKAISYIPSNYKDYDISI